MGKAAKTKAKAKNKTTKSGVKEINKSVLRSSSRISTSRSSNTNEENEGDRDENDESEGEDSQGGGDLEIADIVDHGSQGPVVQQVTNTNLEKLFLEVPRHHRLICLNTVVNNGNNQRRCGHPRCTSRPNKYCSGCSDVLGNDMRLVCFCNSHFPVHIASQCYNAYRMHSEQTDILDDNDNSE